MFLFTQFKSIQHFFDIFVVIFSGMFKVQALCQSISIKGDFNVTKDEICDASLNRQKKEVVTIHKGN